MTIETPREPSLNELCCLTLLGNVAYAVRCARRVQPRFLLAAEMPDLDRMAQVIDTSIRWAESHVASGGGDAEQAEKMAEFALAVSEATCEKTDYAAFAAYHAVRGASLSAKPAAGIADEIFLEVVASAYGASRVLLANLPIWVRNKASAVLRSDYEAILGLNLGTPPERGLTLDATENGPVGPLWPGGVPTW